MQDRAQIVVIGAGIAGSSIAWRLAQLGRKDVLVLEQGELISGTTSHAPGLIGQMRSHVGLTRLLMDSVNLYRGLQLDGMSGFQEVGSLRIASSADRLAECRRQLAFAQKCGLQAQLLTPRETLEKFPLLSGESLHGAIYMPTDGSATAPVLAGAMIRDARALGVSFAPQTTVTAIEKTLAGAVRAVVTDQGRVETETLVIATGIWSPVVGRLAGVSIPLTPIEHQYVETAPIAELQSNPLPNMRDPDNLFYVRQKQNFMVVGGYERNPRPWSTPIPRRENPTVQTFDATHFEPLLDAARRRLPAVASATISRGVNGLESFTTDGAFLLGPAPETPGVWVACGFCAHGVSGGGGVGRAIAHWIVDGDPGHDLSAMSLTRFGGRAFDAATIERLACGVYSTYYDVVPETR
ncbi:MAG TPA: FAD-binding oxidoreductase [Pirellulales bacterium]|jgi:4-methylaminobutanoate oxidase (formaldehyde-forming)